MLHPSTIRPLSSIPSVCVRVCVCWLRHSALASASASLSVQGPKNTPETTVCPFNLQGLSGQNEDGGDATEEPVPDSSVSNV